MIANYIIGALMVITLRIMMVKAVLRRKRKFYINAPNSQANLTNDNLTIIPVKTLIILGSGGHTTEMFRLIKNMGPERYSPKIFVLAETDYQSLSKINAYKQAQEKLAKANEPSQNEPQNRASLSDTSLVDVEGYKLYKIPRSREVNQAWASCLIPIYKALIRSFVLLWHEKPDLIIANGPGTCVPICLAALTYQIIGLSNLPTITYIESICRTETLSMSGKILYYISDLFFVQWDTLKHKYPRSIFLGRLI